MSETNELLDVANLLYSQLYTHSAEVVRGAAEELARLNKALTMAAYEEYLEEVDRRTTFDEFMKLPRVKEYIQACIQEYLDWYGNGPDSKQATA